MSVWWDQRLEPMTRWDEEIEGEIAGAAAVLVIWSPRSVGSRWVRAEAAYAEDKGKLVPLVAERCEIPLAHRLTQSYEAPLSLSVNELRDNDSYRKLRDALRERRDEYERDRPTRQRTSENVRRRQRSKHFWNRARVWGIGAAALAAILAVVHFTEIHLREETLTSRLSSEGALLGLHDLVAERRWTQGFPDDARPTQVTLGDEDVDVIQGATGMFSPVPSAERWLQRQSTDCLGSDGRGTLAV